MSDKTVTVRVISDTPVDRVYKGDTLSLSAATAEQFVALKLVEIVEEAPFSSADEPKSGPNADASLPEVAFEAENIPPWAAT